jgi:AcrR family transcriptional regulator
MIKKDASKGKKDEIYYRILNTALVLELRYGHLKWKTSQLARLSKVSRPLIYYYFGKSKEAVINEAISFFGTEFSGATQNRRQMWKDGKVVQTLEENREILKSIPALMPFYFTNRGQNTTVGENIRKQEESFRKKIKEFFPQLTAEQREFLFACIWGLVFAPELPQKSLQELDKYIKFRRD